MICTITFQQESEHLLEATLDMDEEAVEEGIEKIHTEYVSNIQYNNENSLSSVLAIAYLSSMEYYFKPVRELPTGRGFADFVFIPKPEYVSSYPALLSIPAGFLHLEQMQFFYSGYIPNNQDGSNT